ncbi:MAG: diaminopimelate decarboxylase family protein [Myxococcales bacterium]
MGLGGTLRSLARRWAPRRPDLPPETWGLGRDRKGALRLGPIALHDLLARHGSPLHVLDAARLQSNAARFTSTRCEVFYSYKTNPVPGVLRLLHGAGLGAEVVSPYELWLALRLGVPPGRIVYNDPAKSDESLELAISSGIELINLGNRSEIRRAAAAARRVGRKARVGIRVVPPGNFGGQFGESIESGAALAAFAEAQRQPDLDVVALHAHRNAHLDSLPQLDAFAGGLFRFADALRERLGLTLEIIDFGGNLPCQTIAPLSARERRLAFLLGCPPGPRSPGRVPSIEIYLARILELVAMQKRPPRRIFVEPGRAVTGDAQHLLARVLSVRPPDRNGISMATLDAGLQVADPLRCESHQIFALTPRDRAERRIYRLLGPSCSIGDIVSPAAILPSLEPGDGLAVMDAGAYFVPFSTCFSFPRPAVISVSGSDVEVLRARETFHDLVALDRATLAARNLLVGAVQ